MTAVIIRLRFIVPTLVLLCLAPAASRADDVVLHWDEIAVKTLTTQTPPVSPFAQARFAAIVQLAVFEAVNATTGDYESYLGSPVASGAPAIVAPAGASSEAAAIAAAHAVLVNYFPASAATLDAERAASLALIPDGAAKTNGVSVGLAAAAALIAERLNDGSSPATFYQPPSPLPPGEWDITPGCPVNMSGVPLGGVFYNWPNVRPFGVVVPAAGHWSDPFRPEVPPSLTSNEYRKDYEAVKALGSVGSTARPAGGDTLARFFQASSPTLLFHQATRQLALARHDSLSENARSLALVSMATNDSLVSFLYCQVLLPVLAARHRHSRWRRRRQSEDGGRRELHPAHRHALFPELSLESRQWQRRRC